MKKIWIVVCVVIAGIVVGIVWTNSGSKEEKSPENNTTNNVVQEKPKEDENKDDTNKNTEAKNEIQNQISNVVEVQPEKQAVQQETEVASFTTKIYNKDKERQNNIGITCNSINGKVVQPGETFSFCNTVGKATTAKGYEKADIYVDGKKKQGLGGGNCQVSTTLYNAVTEIETLEVTERHQHSGHVPYIAEGKDAAVAYGSYDFKFVNNTGSAIKILMENSDSNITAKILRIE